MLVVRVMCGRAAGGGVGSRVKLSFVVGDNRSFKYQFLHLERLRKRTSIIWDCVSVGTVRRSGIANFRHLGRILVLNVYLVNFKADILTS